MRLVLFFCAIFWENLFYRTEASSLERQNVICVLAPAKSEATGDSESVMASAMELRSQQHSRGSLTAQDNNDVFPTTQATTETTTRLSLKHESLALVNTNPERKRRRKTKSKDHLVTENHATSLDQHSFASGVSLSKQEHKFAKNDPTGTPTFANRIPHRASAHNEESNDNRLESTTTAATKGAQTEMTVMVTSSMLSINHNGQPSESTFTNAAEPKKKLHASRNRHMGDSGGSDMRKPTGEFAKANAFELTTSMRKAGIPLKSDSEQVSAASNDLSRTQNDKWGTSSNRFNRQFGDTNSQGSAQTSQSTGSPQAPQKTAQKPKKPDHVVPGAILVSTERDPTQDFAARFNATWSDRTTKNNQGNIWEELDNLRGKVGLSAGEIQEILSRSVPGVDYPTHTWIPNTKFSCSAVSQPGFYADPETRCQVIRRCDYNGNRWNYLCPNATLFNQITLVCDWYFNIDCSKAVQYYDYSNSRLYHSDWVLLDSVPEPGMAG